MIITKGDYQWLKSNYPGLTIAESGSEFTVGGEFEFNAGYDEHNGVYVINPPVDQQDDLLCITDRYTIHVTISKDPALVPLVEELGGRIESVAKKLGRSLRDLHIYEGGRTCLVGHLDLSPLDTLPEFMDRAVLQYLFDQACFERFGWWPRGTYAHGLLGLLENYIDRVDRGAKGIEMECVRHLLRYPKDDDFKRITDALLSRSRIGGHLPCVCNSGKVFRHCSGHDRVFRGIWQLQLKMRQDKGLRMALESR